METYKRPIPQGWRWRVWYADLPGRYFTHATWVVARANGAPVAYADTFPEIWQTVEKLIEQDKKKYVRNVFTGVSLLRNEADR